MSGLYVPEDTIQQRYWMRHHRHGIVSAISNVPDPNEEGMELTPALVLQRRSFGTSRTYCLCLGSAHTLCRYRDVVDSEQLVATAISVCRILWPDGTAARDEIHAVAGILMEGLQVMFGVSQP